jgi:ankyrin repeat protein
MLSHSTLTPADRLALNKEFYTAAYTKEPAEIERLFKKGADIHFHHPDFFECTPLYAAAYYGKESAVKTLLLLKADVNCGAGPTHDTPLIVAAHQGHAAICRLLLEHGANPLIVNTSGSTPLSIACTLTPADKKRTIKTMLLEHLARQYDKTNDPAILTHIDAISKKHDAALKEQFADMADPQAAAQRALNEELCLAAYTKEPEEVVRLLDGGANKDFQNPKAYGCTPLYSAASSGKEGNVKVLLERKAEVDKVRADSNDTPLGAAVCKGHTEICRMLLESGADPLAVNKNGMTPLSFAAPHAPADKRAAITNMLLESIINQFAKLIHEDKNSVGVIEQIKRLETQHKTALLFKLILSLLNLGMPVEKITALLPKNLNEYYDATIQDAVCKYISETQDLTKQLILCEQSLWDANHPFYLLCHLPRKMNFFSRSDAVQTIKKLLESVLLKQSGLVSNISDATRATFNQELMACAQKYDKTRLRLLCKVGADINFREPVCGRTPLIEAIIAGNAECVKELLLHDADASIPASGTIVAFNDMAQALPRSSRARLQEFLLQQPDNNNIVITPAQFADIIANADIKRFLSLRTSQQPDSLSSSVVATSTRNLSAPSSHATPGEPLEYQPIYPTCMLAQDSPVSMLPPPPSYLDVIRASGMQLTYQQLQAAPEPGFPPPPSYQEAIRLTGVPLEYRRVQAAPANAQPTVPTLFYHAPGQVAGPEPVAAPTWSFHQTEDNK